jgi:hypothetical protein
MIFGPRERWLCAALPAVITILIYQALQVKPWRREIVVLRAELKHQKAAGDQGARLERARAENGRLTQELHDLRAAAAAKAGAVTNGTGFAAAGRATSLREVSRLCEQSGVTLIYATPAADARLPADTLAAIRTLPGKPGWDEAEVWQLDLRGTYPAMVRLLEALSTSGSLIVPAGISMAPAADEAKPNSWKLTLWI